MEENNELDNLIIQTEKPSGLKKLLLAAALLLLVLIIIILVTKSLIQPEEKPHASIILPPEPAVESKPAAKEPLFEEVPIEEEKPGKEPVEKVIENVKSQQPAKEEQAEKTAPAPAPAEEEATVEEQKPREVAPPPAKPVAEKPESAPKTAAPKGKYFIQVGAFFRYPPNKKFLKSIENEGLHYLIVEGKRASRPYKKVLVGPYPTKAAARADLERVKKRINQNAYITTKK
ncbi:SPOR domain-containing protein [Hydrogenimonas urashimensis]|uniref:SPOR domain-containing protein n=1 Tax=Hydrogenimonas urashimensis TaxID=2740515 RepID=UPI0019160B80|nr:SPOR domain-containing protein [Hydrogenimonas urashimensis]